MRRADEDRWLASRLAPPAARNRLMALYAAYHEIARTAELVREPALGDIRLQFWRDAVAAIYAGCAPPAHPVAQALAACVREASLPRAPLDALIDARARDLDPALFETWAELDLYVQATAGGLLRLAACACAPGVSLGDSARAALDDAGRAWGLMGLARAAPNLVQRGRNPLPREAEAPAQLVDRAEAALGQARRRADAIPGACFPAIAYVALIPGYAADYRAARPRRFGALSRRAALLRAALLGRF